MTLTIAITGVQGSGKSSLTECLRKICVDGGLMCVL